VNKLLLAEGAAVVEKGLLAETGAKLVGNALKMEAVTGGKLAKTILATEDAVKLSPKFGAVGKNFGYIPKASKFAELRAEVIGKVGYGQGRNGLHQYIRIRVIEVVGQAKPGAAAGKAIGGIGGAVRQGAAVGKGGVTGTIEVGSKLTVSHNASVGAKVTLQPGDIISIKGQPFYGASGQVKGLHWTHHARTPNDAGWIRAVVNGIATRFQ
jgi:hypothetical protein